MTKDHLLSILDKVAKNYFEGMSVQESIKAVEDEIEMEGKENGEYD